MRRGQWAARPSVLEDASVNGAITTATLRQGVASGTITNRCRKGGPWQRILPGVILLHNGSPSRLQRNTAALLYGGGECVLSGHASLGALGYARSATMNEVLILVPPHRHPASTSFVVVERTWRMPDPVARGSLRCAPISRSLIDAARRMTDDDRCRALVAETLHRGDVSLQDLTAELAQGPQRYSALPRRVLAEFGENAHSIAELDAQRLYARSGLPAMVFNADVVTASGNFLARPDGWIDDVALAWEIDSLAHHLSPTQHQSTTMRRALMKRHGIIVVEHQPRTLQTNEAVALADLHASYRQALARPRPPVYLRSAMQSA